EHMPQLSILFMFARSCYHVEIHSFPTRRSSDLSWREEAAWNLSQSQGSEFSRSESWEGGGASSVGTARHRSREILARRDGRGEEDRKSTRLNSSHVKISYAVFCLKKKNKDYSPQ